MVRNTMCALSQERLQEVEDVLYRNLDFFKIFKRVRKLFLTDLVTSFCFGNFGDGTPHTV